MGAEVCAESSNITWSWPSSSPASPRISFSVDLSPSDLSVDVKSPRKDSTLELDDLDFDFSVSREVISIHEPSSADELFSDGKLLPQPIRTSSAETAAAAADTVHCKRGSLGEIMGRNKGQQKDLAAQKRSRLAPTNNQRSSFWRFGRSSSVGDGGASAGRLELQDFFCPFPLYRSKSVGSKPNPNSIPKRRHYFSKLVTNTNCTTATTASTAKTYYYSGSQIEGVRVSPVTNVPPPLLPRANNNYYNSGGNYSTYSSSIIAYLLCSCRSKGMRTAEMIYSSSP